MDQKKDECYVPFEFRIVLPYIFIQNQLDFLNVNIKKIAQT